MPASIQVKTTEKMSFVLRYRSVNNSSLEEMEEENDEDKSSFAEHSSMLLKFSSCI